MRLAAPLTAALLLAAARPVAAGEPQGDPQAASPDPRAAGGRTPHLATGLAPPPCLPSETGFLDRFVLDSGRSNT